MFVCGLFVGTSMVPAFTGEIQSTILSINGPISEQEPKITYLQHNRIPDYTDQIMNYKERLSDNLPYRQTTIIDEEEWDIVVPDDYNTIQEAVDTAESGDRIFVRNGTYKENIVVYKEGLKIYGEDKYTTIIDGNNVTHAIDILSENVTINGFTVKNGCNEEESLWDLSGIVINASNTKITGNVIMKNRLGISSMTKTSDLVICDNEFIDDGLMLGNYVYNNELSTEDFIHKVENNTVNGKPLVYLKNQNDAVVDSNAGQVILANCSNITVKNLGIKDTDFSIILAGCKNCIIEDNVIDETDGELILFSSEENMIRNNTVSNGLHGICMDFDSKNNVVLENTIVGNWVGISSLTGTSGNIIKNNVLEENIVGIEISTYYPLLKCSSNEVIGNMVSESKIGIVVNEGSFDHNFTLNTIKSCTIFGFQIEDVANISIENNNFERNLLFNFWFSAAENIKLDNNFWGRARILPKIVFGLKNFNGIPIPGIMIDRNPARSLFE